LYRGAKPNKICFSPLSHWLCTDFIYTDFDFYYLCVCYYLVGIILTTCQGKDESKEVKEEEQQPDEKEEKMDVDESRAAAEDKALPVHQEEEQQGEPKYIPRLLDTAGEVEPKRHLF
jgi:hypothetical protein